MTTYRKATPSDITELNTLVNSAYRGEAAAQGWTTEAHLIEGQRTDPTALAEMLETGRIELALEGEEIVACVYVRKESPTVLYIGMLTVKTNFQSRGLGGKLMRRAEEIGREWGLKSTRMTVISERPELIAIYEKMGFSWNGKTEPFPDHDPRNGKPLKKLTFLEYVKNL
jgi:ribosomal protein S18 acetylase RimI-like enzyme